MSAETSSSPIALTGPVHADLVRLASAVSLKQVELENAQLRQELAIRRVLDALGLAGQKVRVDLDGGVIHVLREMGGAPS
jgi:hypothetical protein